MSRAFVFRPLRYFRRLADGPALRLAYGGTTHEVEPGDYLLAAAASALSPPDRKRLGGAILVAKLQAQAGEIGEGQVVVRLPNGTPPTLVEHAPAAASSWPTPVVIRCGAPRGADFRRELHAAVDAGAPVLLIPPGVTLPLGEERTAELLQSAAVRAGADVAFPISNASTPFSLPLNTDDGSPLPRVPGGRSVWEIAEALADGGGTTIAGRPTHPACALLVPEASESLLRNGALSAAPARCRAVVAVDVFVYRDRDEAGPLHTLIPGSVQSPRGWVDVVAAQHRRIALPRPGRPPVALYSSNVGPWGGVAVLFRLADELQRLGLHAFVVHQTTTEHKYRPLTPPLKVRRRQQMIADWPRLAGHEQSIVIGSHWGSGKTIAELVARHRGVVASSFLQDREDLFEQPDGRPLRSDAFRDYLAIGRGVSVSHWVLDSARADLGLRGDYEVIPPGIDLDVFRPSPEQRTGGPVRILAMWRPQTAIRRGGALLREVYDEIHQRFGARVSLEVFGWNDRAGPGRAPDYVLHHGHLAPEQVAATMADVDVVVEPSAYQGWGLSGVEGLACGAAVVSTDCRGPRDYIRHGENGLLVPHAELGAAVVRVIEDDDLRRRLQSAGPASVAHLAWPKIGARWALHLANLWGRAGGTAWRDEFAAVQERARTVLGALEPSKRSEPR